jgi:hypothetical protein
MSLSQKELKAFKEKLRQKDPSALNSIKNRKNNKEVTKKIVYKKDKVSTRKNIVRWNFSVNQLVTLVGFLDGEIGLIVSDFEYFSNRVEKNCFFVLIDNRVVQLDGKYMRAVENSYV